MEFVLTIVQLVAAVLLIVTILMQQKGAGLGAAFGSGSDNVYATKRGAEKFLFYSTIVLSGLFLGIALVRLFIA